MTIIILEGAEAISDYEADHFRVLFMIFSLIVKVMNYAAPS